MLRFLLRRLVRATLFMLAGAAIVVAAQLYGPSLIADRLPAGLRPETADAATMTPQRIFDALREIRGALE